MIKTTLNKGGRQALRLSAHLKIIPIFCIMAIMFTSFATLFIFENVYANEETNEPFINGEFLDFHGIKLPKDTILDDYYLDVNLTQLKYKGLEAFYIVFGDKEHLVASGEREYSIILRFNNIHHEQDGNLYNLRILTKAKMNLKLSQNGYVYTPTFKEDIRISLSNGLFKMLKKMESENSLDFSSISIMVTGQTSSGKEIAGAVLDNDWFTKISAFNIPCELDKRSVVLEDVIEDPSFGGNGDPLSPDNDNGNPNTSDNEAFDFWTWLIEKMFNPQSGLNQVIQVALWIGAVVVFAFALNLISTILRLFK